VCRIKDIWVSAFLIDLWMNISKYLIMVWENKHFTPGSLFTLEMN